MALEQLLEVEAVQRDHVRQLGKGDVFVEVLKQVGARRRHAYGHRPLWCGAPGGGTRTYIHYFYDIGFRSSKFGRAAACAMVLFFIVLLVSVLQTRLSNRFIQE